MSRAKSAPSLFVPDAGLPRGANLVLRCTGSDTTSRSILKRITRRLDELGVPRERCDDIEIVLAEALNNIVEHAYAARKDGPLELRAYLGDKSIRFELVDEGAVMPGNTPPAGSPVSEGIDPLMAPEGGFGWHLIRSLARNWTYRREGRYNVTSFDLEI